jgi:hypothetical protein
MKKTEIFALFTGIVGLLADTITLTIFFIGRLSATDSTAPQLSPKAQTFIILTMIYGWFIISWILVRRHWVNAREKGSTIIRFSKGVWAQNQLFQRASHSVYAIGIMILPFSMMLPVNDHVSDSSGIRLFVFLLIANCISLAFIGFLVLMAIMLLMPIVYSDMYEMFEL